MRSTTYLLEDEVKLCDGSILKREAMNRVMHFLQYVFTYDPNWVCQLYFISRDNLHLVGPTATIKTAIRNGLLTPDGYITHDLRMVAVNAIVFLPDNRILLKDPRIHEKDIPFGPGE